MSVFRLPAELTFYFFGRCDETCGITGSARQFLRRSANPIWKPPADHLQLCRDVVEQVVRQSGEVILDSAIRETSGIDPHHWGQLGRDLIRRSLAALDEDKRLVFTLKVLHQCSYEEIAAITGFSVAKLKTDLHRARAEMRRRISPYAGVGYEV